jgi:two-component system LytT family response regulator
MISTVIVDDDVFHIEALTKLLKSHFSQVKIVAVSSNVPDAVEKIDKLKPQLIFLDIEMSPYSGFDLLEMVSERNFEVIFTTAYQQYAIQAIKASALDYIEKPVQINDLKEALARYREKTGNNRIRNLLTNFNLPLNARAIALYNKGGLNFYRVKDIIRCQSDNVYTEFFIFDRNNKSSIIRVEVSKGLSYYEDILTSLGSFYRVHNKHIVNIGHIRKYTKEEGGFLIMDDQTNISIPVARARKDDFIRYLKSNGIAI